MIAIIHYVYLFGIGKVSCIIVPTAAGMAAVAIAPTSIIIIIPCTPCYHLLYNCVRRKKKACEFESLHAGSTLIFGPIEYLLPNFARHKTPSTPI